MFGPNSNARSGSGTELLLDSGTIATSSALARRQSRGHAPHTAELTPSAATAAARPVLTAPSMYPATQWSEPAT